MSDLSRQIADLSPEKLQALRDRLAGRRKEAPPARIPRLPRRAEGDNAFPLSFAQRRLWFHHQLEPASLDYNLFGIFDIEGALDRRALAAALRALVERHEVLRTTFASASDQPGGEPVQIVHPPGAPALPVVDLSRLAEPHLSAASSAALEAGLLVPFDLVAGPLLRLALVRLGEGEHLLYLYYPHILSDAWSQRLLYRDLDAAYAAAVAGRPLPGDPMALQYADFAAWQRGELEGPALDRLLGWWRELLGESPPPLELPTDRPRTALVSSRGRRETLRLPRPLAERAAALARGAGASPMMAFLAAFALLLHRASGQDDLLVGSPVANRDRPEVQEVMGFFVNLLVLPVRFRQVAGESFRRLLAVVREVSLGAFAHQDLPFERLVEALAPERLPGRNPLAEVMFNFIPRDTPGLAMAADLEIGAWRPEAFRVQFDLSFVLEEEPGGFDAQVDYRADLFDRATVARLLARYERLLAGAVADPDRLLDALEPLAAGERHQLLVEWNDTASAWPEEAGIHHRVAARAAGLPDAVALAAGELELSYGELVRRAGEVAAALAARGVGVETLVPVEAERRLSTLVEILGILTAGAAYLPLDPSQPAERRRAILKEAATGSAGVTPALSWGGWASPEQLAYVIFTSGSTGRPKGVAAAHRAVVRLVEGTDYFAAEPGDVFVQLAPLGFDASTFEVWGSLVHGARLELFPGEASDVAALARFVVERGVTHLWLTTELFHALVTDGLDALAAAPGLRHLMTGGDVISPERVVEALARLPGVRLTAFYGPTENTTFSTAVDLTDGCSWEKESAGRRRSQGPLPPVPLGRPIRQSSAVVLDVAGHPAPIGVPGELGCAGVGLARGYLGDPVRTAAAFVPHPAAAVPGERLYRSGDRVRQLADGTLTFLGRLDHQVKIRGFRVEPGEVEAALATHPQVAEAVVLALPHPAEGKRLVAFLRAVTGEAPGAAVLRAYLESLLPPAMRPELYVPLAAWPLSPNGKIDRGALARLPLPAAGTAIGASEERVRTGGGRRPVDGLLAAVLELWREVLGAPAAGPDDDFFDLGGHSLLATRLVSALRRSLGGEIPLRTLFDHPTPAAFARAVAADRRSAEVPPLALRVRPARLPLSFGQERLWFLDRLEPGGTAYHMAEGLALEGAADGAALARAVAAVVRRHEVLRTRFGEAAGEPFQIVDPPPTDGALAALPQVDLSRLAGLPSERAAWRRAAAKVAAVPFDLTAGPILRAVHFRRAGGDLLFVALHHIAADGWSLRLLADELGTLYRAFSAGRPDPLPPLPLQYADYALWQRGWLAGETLARELAWWRERLGVDPPALELPADRPRPPVQSFAGAALTRRLAPTALAALRNLARSHGATLFMTLLAGFAALLGRLASQERVIVGSPIANRHRPEVEPLVGFFVNTLVFGFDLPSARPFTEVLAAVREETLGAYEHQDAPFEKLVEALAPRRDLSRNPLFQVLFDFHSDLARGAVRDDADADLPREAAICDLALSAFAGGEELTLGAEHATALFDGTTVVRWLASLERLLAAAAAAPERSLADLPLLGEGERHQLLAEWSGAVSADVDEGFPSILQQIAARATQDPAAVAAEQGERRLTYGELRAASLSLAGRLARAGVGPETRVGLALPRGPELMVAVLGVLAAGGAWVPLDPEYPAPRLARLLSGVDRLLAAPGVALPEGPAVPRLPWELLADSLAAPAGTGELLELEIDPRQLAYVIATSGSTGEPKGVMIDHGALATFTRATAEHLALGPGDRVLQLAALGFDVVVEEIFPTLAAGATLVFPPGGGALAPAEITRLCRSARLTGFELPTHLWVEWTEELTARGEFLPETLRYVLTGTERLAPAHLAAWRRLGVPLHHILGVTEATVTTLVHPVRATEPELGAGERLPVGRPLPGATAHVLGPDGAPVPLGVTGELAIGGAGVGRGYLGRPAETAARFVPDPFAGRPGARLYLTGDLVRRRADGEIVFLGRADGQVKIQGVRIEPGEVEAALLGHPAVAQAVAALRHDLPGGGGLVAYVVLRAGAASAPSELLAALRAELPAASCPTAVVLLDALPTTAHGKVDRSALPPPRRELRPPSAGPAAASALERQLAEIWAAVLALPAVGAEESFFELGGNSLLLVRVHRRLAEAGHELPLVELFRHPTVRALAAHLATGREVAEMAALPQGAPTAETAVAVVGMAGRFPGAPDLAAYWENLRAGVESLTVLTDEELLAAGIPAEEIADPRYVRRRGTLGDVAGFDAPFFGMSPREAELLDPQHRLFLETAWAALEASGHDPAQLPGRIGIFAGCSRDTYTFHNVLPHGEGLEGVDETQLSLSSSGTFLPTRASYKLDLRGPSVNVQTACSTSLVAVALAHRSLLAGECDLALAGGVSLAVPRAEGVLYREGGILSPDGRCLPFDTAAAGTVAGEGVGLVVLKRLADAEAEGDTIHAVLLGSAVNNDGAGKIGFTAPGVDGQAEVIARAQAMAGIGPRDLGYVEAHGTGTALGDPTEIAALTRAFRRGTEERGFCALGSVKHNIGHADDAAGIAGLLKAVLAVERGEIPPSPYFTAPNPGLDLPASPFYLPTALRPWAGPRYAGVSSFGIGGTNAHVVVGEAPARPPRPAPVGPELLLVSARTPAALAARVADLAAALAAPGAPALADAAFTLEHGRRAMAHRAAFLARTPAEAAAALARGPRGGLGTGAPGDARRPVVFLFPGQGAPLPGRVGELLAAVPELRAALAEAARLAVPQLGRDLLALLDPPAGEHEEAAAVLADTAFAQPALFAVEHALARWLIARGVEPAAMVGHSLGEYVAACLAGVFSFEEGLALVAERGRLMAALPPGAMTAVSLPATDLRPLLDELGLDLAAVNAPDRAVASGASEAIASLEARLAAGGVACRRLPVARAFHSRLMEAAAAPFGRALAGLAWQPPRLPWLSNVTGRWITAAEAVDPAYWLEHLRQPVELAAGFATLAAELDACPLEVGPGEGLGRAWDRGRRPDAAAAVACLPSTAERPAADDLFAVAGRLWLAGVPVDGRHWRGPEGAPAGRVPLPTYPFEHRRYWIDPPARAAEPTAGALAKDADPSRWFYAPDWAPAPLPRRTAVGEEGAWLLLGGPDEAAGAVAMVLVRQGIEAVRLALEPNDPTDPTDPTDRSDAEAIARLRDLAGHTFTRALHLGGLGDEPAPLANLLGFVAAWARLRPGEPLALVVAGNGLVGLPGDAAPEPARTGLLALGRVLPQELPHLSCRTVDLDAVALADPRWAERLVAEVRGGEGRAVACRGARRHAERFVPLPLPAAGAAEGGIPRGGVCLVTGGLGELGLLLAEHLHRTLAARLVLLGRTALPERPRWPGLAAGDDPLAARLRRLLALEEAGAQVLTVTADVADPAAVAAAVAAGTVRFSAVDAVFHLAGLTSDEHYPSILDTTAAVLAAHRAPKVLGLLALDAALADAVVRPAVAVAFSSLATALGGLGYVAYTAANLEMEAMARRLRQIGGLPWVTVGWDGWLPADGEIEGEGVGGLGATHRLALTPAEGLEALGRILVQDGMGEVLVSTAPLAARLAGWQAPAPPPAPAARHERPSLAAPYAAPRDEFEAEVAEILAGLLGVERVGIDDNFYELGGDSLLAIHAASRIGRALGVEITGVELLAAPTVAEVTLAALEKLAAAQGDDILAAELAAVGASGDPA